MAPIHSSPKLCECGCGSVSPCGARFIRGHSKRIPAQLFTPDDPRGPNPSGLCLCGCGQTTPLSKDTRFGRIKGCYTRLIKGHVDRSTPAPAVEVEPGTCACGCGTVLTTEPRFIKGHNARLGQKGSAAAPDDPRGPNPDGICKCGCGEKTPLSTDNKHSRIIGCFTEYCFGHGQRKTQPVGNPSGICLCGCGRPTPIALQTRMGNLAGSPCQYLLGHRIIQSYKVNTVTDCWEMKTRRSDGYSRVHRDGKNKLVMGHIYYWEKSRGPVTDGMQLDHLCRNRCCVNPDHLEPVTFEENQRRIRAESPIPDFTENLQPITDPQTGCWNFPITQADGYARVWFFGHLRTAHRVFYENAEGQIQNGLELDHLCRNRACVNPDHLEPVTHIENMRRAAEAKRLRRERENLADQAMP